MTPSLLSECRQTLARVDGAFACAVVDLRAGAWLAYAKDRDGGAALGEVAATLWSRLFTGVGRLAALAGGGQPGELYLMVAGRGRFGKLLSGGTHALLVETSAEANLGRTWAQIKAGVPAFEKALAGDGQVV